MFYLERAGGHCFTNISGFIDLLTFLENPLSEGTYLLEEQRAYDSFFFRAVSWQNHV